MRRFSLILLAIGLGVATPSFAGTWTHVTGCGQETTSTLTHSCSVTVNAGDLIFVGADCGGSSAGETASVSDGGDTFTARLGGTNGIANGTDHSWAFTAVPASGGAKTVTLTFAGNTCSFHEEWIDVFRDTNGVGTFNTGASATGTSTGPTVSVTSVGSNDLIIGWVNSTDSSISAGAGYTLGSNGNSVGSSLGNEYQLGSTAGAHTFNATTGSSAAWIVLAITVQEGTGGGASAPARKAPVIF